MKLLILVTLLIGSVANAQDFPNCTKAQEREFAQIVKEQDKANYYSLVVINPWTIDDEAAEYRAQNDCELKDF
jgi:hypothetical protein